jgi:hypothetical protein
MEVGTMPRFAASGIRRPLVGLAVVPWLIVACGGGAGTAGQTTRATPSAAAMNMQPGAEKMKANITAPASGTTVTANTITAIVTTSGFADSCDTAGKPVKEGQGHYHIELDKSLVNMFCTPEATISLQNVKPGAHTLTIIPAQNDHSEVEDNAHSVAFTYQPSAASAEIRDDATPGKPSIKIVSPKAGDTVSGSFDVTVEVRNFHNSCDLYGKPDLSGYGHWHLNLDSTSLGMGGMGTMVGMSCTTTFGMSTAGLRSGSTHSVIALLVDNGHAPFKPEISDKVDVKIK